MNEPLYGIYVVFYTPPGPILSKIQGFLYKVPNLQLQLFLADLTDYSTEPDVWLKSKRDYFRFFHHAVRAMEALPKGTSV